MVDLQLRIVFLVVGRLRVLARNLRVVCSLVQRERLERVHSLQQPALARVVDALQVLVLEPLLTVQLQVEALRDLHDGGKVHEKLGTVYHVIQAKLVLVAEQRHLLAGQRLLGKLDREQFVAELQLFLGQRLSDHLVRVHRAAHKVAALPQIARHVLDHLGRLFDRLEAVVVGELNDGQVEEHVRVFEFVAQRVARGVGRKELARVDALVSSVFFFAELLVPFLALFQRGGGDIFLIQKRERGN